jgi:hypothetical protein
MIWEIVNDFLSKWFGKKILREGKYSIDNGIGCAIIII